ncbi:hypothetical protein KDL44_02930 [bacterium]|nr:hypothetical protein [bacterium]
MTDWEMKHLLDIGTHCEICAIRFSDDIVTMELIGPRYGEECPFTIKLMGVSKADFRQEVFMCMGGDPEIADSRLVRNGEKWLWEVLLDDSTLGARVEFTSYWTDRNWPIGINQSMGYDPDSGTVAKAEFPRRGCLGF